MRRIIYLVQVALIAASWLWVGSLTAKGETVYPASLNITSTYELSDSLLSTLDTLTISRTIINNENFTLTGLYFSDNFHPAITMVTYDLQVEGISVTPTFTDNHLDTVVPGFEAFWWQIDDPQNSGGTHDSVGPGETVSLIIRLVIDSIGTYSFPLHATVFMGDTTGTFATGETLFVRTVGPLVNRINIDLKIKDFLDGNATEEEVQELIEQYISGGN